MNVHATRVKPAPASRHPRMLLTQALVIGAALHLVNARVTQAQQAYSVDTVQVTVGSRVSAALPAATRSVEVIRAETLARQPGQTIQDVLARALGVDVSARSPAQADIAIRGGTFEQVLVLVDGMRVSNAQTGHFDLDIAVPLQEVERIEILRGPASALYGADALGGVVNIVTRRHTAAGLHAQVDGGSFETAAMAGGARVAGNGVSIGATADYRSSDGHRPGTDYRMASAHVAAETQIRQRPLRGTFGIADRDFGASKFYTSPAANFDEYERTRALHGQLAWEAPRTTRFAVEPRVSVVRHDDDFVLRRDEPEFYQNVHRTWQVGSEVIARYTDTALRVSAGGEVYRDLLESTSLGDREENRAAVFAEVGLGTIGTAVATTGVRLDWHAAYGSFVAPSVAGAVWIAPAAQLRASISRAFRAPTWTDRFYNDPANIGNAELEPEQAWEGEAGFELRTGELRTVLSGFVRRTESLMDWARPTGSEPTAPWQIMNVAEATFRGVELSVHDLNVLGARWTARFAGISFSHTSGDFESKYALRPLTRQASLEMDRAIAGLDVYVRGALSRRAGDETFTTLDARVSRTYRSARIFFDVLNATDTEYLDVSGVTAAGRSMYAGINWNWR